MYCSAGKETVIPQSHATIGDPERPSWLGDALYGDTCHTGDNTQQHVLELNQSCILKDNVATVKT